MLLEPAHCPSLCLCHLLVEAIHLMCRMGLLVSPQLAASRDRPPSLPCSRWVLGYPPFQDRVGQALFMPFRLSCTVIIYGLLNEYREIVRWGICPNGEQSAFLLAVSIQGCWLKHACLSSSYLLVFPVFLSRHPCRGSAFAVTVWTDREGGDHHF